MHDEVACLATPSSLRPTSTLLAGTSGFRAIKHMLRIFFSCIAAWLGFTISTAAAADSLPMVPHVDLGRYAGTWHEIARLPNWFQR